MMEALSEIGDWLTKNVTTVNALISAIMGLVTGVIGSLAAPWIHWGIEKKRLRLQTRKEKISKWREEISSHNTFLEFAKTSTFQELRSYIPQDEIKMFYNTWIDRNPKIDTEASKLLRFHEIVSQIEKEWRII